MSNKKVVNAALRSDLRMFIQRTFTEVSPGQNYVHNWHVDAIAHHLTQCKEGACRRLLMTIPPRHLKSVSGSVAFTAWLLGHEPTARIICVSYTPLLAEKFSDDVRLVMESDWYRQVFPGTRISPHKNTKAEFGTTKHGFRMATSVGGPLTGRGGGYLIIDDPHKADDAYSDAKRAAVIDWYRHTAASRLDDPETGCIIVIQQRFHEADLAGTLLESGGWTHLNLPAIAETAQDVQIGPKEYHQRKPGDVLHPERLSKARLDEIRSDIGDYAFAGQYQQQPAPAGGGIVKWSWFRQYTGVYEREVGDRIIQSWDLAWTVADLASYSVCTTWLYRNHRLYLLDVLRDRMEMPDLSRLVPQHAEKWDAQAVVLEQTGAGLGLLQQLRRDHDPQRLKYLGNAPTEDKSARLQQVVPLITEGRIYVPTEAPWLETFRLELESFPNGKYADQVDSLTQALMWFWCRTPAPPRGMFGGGSGGDTPSINSRRPRRVDSPD